MNRIRSHKDIEVWKRSIELVKEIYLLTSKFPETERFGLSDQMRRAVISIPSNISEGAARKSINEYIRFLYIARDSISELETQLIIAQKLSFIEDTGSIHNELGIIFRMLSKLICTLSARKNKV